MCIADACILGTAEPGTRLPIQQSGKEFPFLSLAATRLKEVYPPIQLRPGVTVMDIDIFIVRTLQDLASYVSAANRGSKHWVATLLDEKIEGLERCGVKAEIRKVQ